MDQIGHCLGLRQIKLPIQKCPLGKLPRLGRSCTMSDQQFDYLVDNVRRPMGGDLHRIFLGKEVGATKRETSTSSIIFSPSRMLPKWMVWEACFSRSFPLKIPLVNLMASFPDRRITAMAPTPWGVAKATMVSSRSLMLKLIYGLKFSSNEFREVKKASG